MVIIQFINILSTLPGLVVVESWGRRRLLIVGAIGMALSQLLIASFAAVTGDSTGDEKTQNYLDTEFKKGAAICCKFLPKKPGRFFFVSA